MQHRLFITQILYQIHLFKKTTVLASPKNYNGRPIKYVDTGTSLDTHIKPNHTLYT